MSPIEHYFENLLTMGSDIKGEPNKNALSREVQEAVEICADYVKYDLLLRNTKADMVAMLTEIQLEIEEKFNDRPFSYNHHQRTEFYRDIDEVIQQKINSLKEA